MANEYKQGKDRVAVDESFPYPIKAVEYGQNYVEVTPLYIPEHCGYFDAQTYMQLGTDNLQEIYQEGKLCLCIEIKNMCRSMCSGRTHGKYSQHVCKSGRWHVPANGRTTAEALVENFVLGRSYVFPISDILDVSNSHIRRERNMWESYRTRTIPFLPVRATYRVIINNDLNFVRKTGVYSNIVNVRF